MSLLDTRYPELDNFLQRWQRRLNTRLSAGEGLLAWTAAAPAAVAAALAFQPDPSARPILGLALAALATLASVLWRRRHRLSRHEAASWLDERGQTRGLFRAASECLDAPDPGLGGAHVLAEANRRRADFRGPSAPRLPWRRLAVRGLAASVATVLTAALLMIPAPVLGQRGTRAEPAGGTPAPSLTPDRPGGDPRELSPREAAQRLFPEDARLAALAEQALASGDPGALNSLLEQNAAQQGRGTPPAGAPSPGGTPGQNSGQDGSSDGTTSPETGRMPSGEKGGAGSSPSPGGSQAPGKEPGPGSGGKTPSKPGSSPEGADAPAPGRSGQAAGEAKPGQNDGGGGSMFPSGGAPGTGHSQQPLGIAPPAGTSNRQLVLKDQENPGVFEYVLPSTGPQLPAAQTLADSRRSAEAVISRTSPPLEFENTIRDYFLSLTTLTQAQEASK